ncbi:hypothetical protein CXB51_026084 [Gossypium anomalum]|uniref:Uncharacterized protein n=3 Tax=Gossypium TaxID=3633 RepID=A0A8J5YRU8_9ROSI|nr:hypothetical protein CXB51_026084 [Gossypium anomalum]
MDSLSKFMRSRTSFSLLEGKMLARSKNQEKQRCCQVQGPLLQVLVHPCVSDAEKADKLKQSLPPGLSVQDL